MFFAENSNSNVEDRTHFFQARLFSFSIEDRTWTTDLVSRLTKSVDFNDKEMKQAEMKLRILPKINVLPYTFAFGFGR